MTPDRSNEAHNVPELAETDMQAAKFADLSLPDLYSFKSALEGFANSKLHADASAELAYEMATSLDLAVCAREINTAEDVLWKLLILADPDSGSYDFAFEEVLSDIRSVLAIDNDQLQN